MKAYKLLRKRKDGSLGSLFINKRARLPVGVWMDAESHERKGYKYRPYWHAMREPLAPHLKMDGREWWIVEVDKNARWMHRPESQGGAWILANRIKLLEPLAGASL